MINSPNARGIAGTFSGWRRLAVVLVSIVEATAVFAGSQFSAVVAFGDSLSDTGTLYRLSDGGFPLRIAYHNGRQTNGPVWVEYVADTLGLDHQLKDYAVVGAMTGPTLAVPTGNVWSSDIAGLEGTSLRGQLNHYLADTRGRVDAHALYIVEGGANDLIGPISALLMNPPASMEEFMQQVNDIATPMVINIATIVGTLKALGAQHIAVVNVPDFGKAPRIVAYGPIASASVSMLMGLINDAVAAQLTAIDLTGGNKIARIDAFGLIESVASDPASFGFINVTEQFMTLDRATLTVTYAGSKHRDVRDWFFWDDLHPTTRGHAVLARFALGTLQTAFPPPAGH